MSLKEQIKSFAYALGADLVGFGGIDRCAHAPIMMSPQGLYPDARTVIVMALHHPDACIELGGEQHPQEIGPYSVQYLMNSRLDEMSYRLGTFLERLGYGAVPIVSSNIWRYNEYKDLKAVFAPDVSHIYMAVVAGLADIGYSGLALSPEYGARNRFITVITNAEIEADPLIPPGTVCDSCMLCRKHCPAQALSKEIKGEKTLKIGEYEYRFPDKNLWRCSWGEHFDLDLDLEIPEVVTEQVVLDNVKLHGIRSGEMGQCLKFCVPGPLRTFDRAFSRTPMRQHWMSCDESKISRAVADRILTRTTAKGAETVVVSSADELRQKGIDLNQLLPGAVSAVTVAVACPPWADGSMFHMGARHQIDSICLDLTRDLEDLGFRSVMTVLQSSSHPDSCSVAQVTQQLLAGIPQLQGQTVIANTVVTRMTIPPQQRSGGTGRRTDYGDATADLTGGLAALARELGADLTGVAPARRIDEIAGQLRPYFDKESVLDAHDRSIRFTPWAPEITERTLRVRTPQDHLPEAKSVFVFGLRLHKEVLRWATKPPAEAVGPYSFQTYITHWLSSVIGYRLIKHLQALGYKAVMTSDLTGTDSVTANPRGPQPDLFSNRFAGVAAGLGSLTVSGHLATPQFGIRQRLMAIVTDAPLTASVLDAAKTEPCAECAQPCISSCPSKAITAEPVEFSCEGRSFRFNRIDAKRCDWVKRYALAGDSGFKYLGSKTDVAAPETPAVADLAAALLQHDPIKKYRPVVAEPCVLNCPLADV